MNACRVCMFLLTLECANVQQCLDVHLCAFFHVFVSMCVSMGVSGGSICVCPCVGSCECLYVYLCVCPYLCPCVSMSALALKHDEQNFHFLPQVTTTTKQFLRPRTLLLVVNKHYCCRSFILSSSYSISSKLLFQTSCLCVYLHVQVSHFSIHFICFRYTVSLLLSMAKQKWDPWDP